MDRTAHLLRKPGIKTVWLQCFVSSCQKSSLTTAAQAMGMTAAALRRNLELLEQQLGVRLLAGKSDAIVPTPLGQLVYEEATVILRELKRISSLMAVSPGRQTAVLNLGCARDWLQPLLLPLCGLLRQQLPGLTLRMEQLAGQSELEQALLDGKLDLALDWREPLNEGISCLGGSPQPYVVVSAPHPKRHWESWHYATPWVKQGYFKPWDHAGYPQLNQLESGHFSTLLDMALSGLCALYVPEYLVRAQLVTGSLVRVAEPPVFHAFTPLLLWNEQRADTDFASLARTYFAALSS
ncbi:MAG TPA: LysR family transcriptional regulator [Candidatus Obscuribacterales bacterium]